MDACFEILLNITSSNRNQYVITNKASVFGDVSQRNLCLNQSVFNIRVKAK